MDYKSLVTSFRSSKLDSDHLDAAIDLATRKEAHLRVLVTGIEQVLPDTFYGGASTAVLQSTINEALDAARAAEDEVTPILERSGIAFDVASVVAQIGALGSIVSRYVALSDLVILPKPYGGNRTTEDVALTEAALFSTRTPVLVLPRGQTTIPDAKSVVVAWDMSAEALTAIRAALSVLKTASKVNILIIDPPENGAQQSDPGLPLAELLTRHGCAVEVTVLSKTLPRVSDVIQRHVSDTGADMVVMGAYGHSRFREAILGGTTRNMLEQAEVPVLMAH